MNELATLRSPWRYVIRVANRSRRVSRKVGPIFLNLRGRRAERLASHYCSSVHSAHDVHGCTSQPGIGSFAVPF